jgi:hypothetical protein
LLYSVAAVQAQFTSGKQVFYVIRRPELDPILPQFARWEPRILWDHDRIVILRFDAAANASTLDSGAPGER